MNNAASAEIPHVGPQWLPVRTMVRGDVKSLRTGETRRRDLGIASGAQILTTITRSIGRPRARIQRVTRAERVRWQSGQRTEVCVFKSPID
jgi:hypothetical protein